MLLKVYVPYSCAVSSNAGFIILPCGCSHPALHPLTQQYPALQHQQVQQHARTCSCNCVADTL